MSWHRGLGRWTVTVAAVGSCWLAGCGPKEDPVTSEAVARVVAARQEAIEAAAASRGTTRPAETETPAATSPSASVEQVTLEPAGGVEAPKTLAEASAAERRRRHNEPTRASVVITNDNLSEFAAQGQVTEATVPDVDGNPGAEAPTGSSPGAASSVEAAATDPTGDTRGEHYWRQRVREVRVRWAEATEEIATLEEETADLRWSFYAEDDPYYRDQRIKPEWDRALDDLRRARQDARSYQRELGDVLAEGRADGALPGWLREGIELEPEPPSSAESAEREGDPREPTILDESGERP